jgi:hypothetical protein
METPREAMRRRTSRARAVVIVAGTVGALGAAAGIGAQAAAGAPSGDDRGESSTAGTGIDQPATATSPSDDDDGEGRAAPATPVQPRLSPGNAAQAPQATSSGS